MCVSQQPTADNIISQDKLYVRVRSLQAYLNGTCLCHSAIYAIIVIVTVIIIIIITISVS